MDVVTPDIDAVTSNQHCVRVWVLLHSLLEELSQVFLVGCVLDDGDAERVMVAQVSRLVHALAEALDLLNVVDLEDPVVAGALGLEEQRDEDGPLGVGVNAAAGAAAGERGEEERRALGRLVDRGRSDVGALLERGLLGGEGEDVDVGGLHELLLDT